MIIEITTTTSNVAPLCIQHYEEIDLYIYFLLGMVAGVALVSFIAYILGAFEKGAK